MYKNIDIGKKSIEDFSTIQKPRITCHSETQTYKWTLKHHMESQFANPETILLMIFNLACKYGIKDVYGNLSNLFLESKSVVTNILSSWINAERMSHSWFV